MTESPTSGACLSLRRPALPLGWLHSQDSAPVCKPLGAVRRHRQVAIKRDFCLAAKATRPIGDVLVPR